MATKQITTNTTPATEIAAATPAVSTKRALPTLVHRVNTQMKTQVLKGAMTSDELDQVITHCTKLKEIAAILAAK